MGFNNFPSLHTNLLPAQGDWATYSGGYSTQDSQAYMTAQQNSYNFSHHQNPYAYAATMFGATSPSNASSGGPDPLGNSGNSTFYTSSTGTITASVPEPTLTNHDHGSPTNSYKLDFNNIVDEKILSDSGNDGEGSMIKSQ